MFGLIVLYYDCAQSYYRCHNGELIVIEVESDDLVHLFHIDIAASAGLIGA